MNFKFTKLKIIVAIIPAIIFGIYVYYSSSNSCFGGPCGSNWLFDMLLLSLIIGIIIFALIYVVWSLIQKKEEIKK